MELADRYISSLRSDHKQVVGDPASRDLSMPPPLPNIQNKLEASMSTMLITKDSRGRHQIAQYLLRFTALVDNAVMPIVGGWEEIRGGRGGLLVQRVLRYLEDRVKEVRGLVSVVEEVRGGRRGVKARKGGD